MWLVYVRESQVSPKLHHFTKFIVINIIICNLVYYEKGLLLQLNNNSNTTCI